MTAWPGFALASLPLPAFPLEVSIVPCHAQIYILLGEPGAVWIRVEVIPARVYDGWIKLTSHKL